MTINLSAFAKPAYDRFYVEKQIDFYNSTYSQRSRDDCLYRIASHADVFPPAELLGPLTENQKEIVLKWLTREGFRLFNDLYSA